MDDRNKGEMSQHNVRLNSKRKITEALSSPSLATTPKQPRLSISSDTPTTSTASTPSYANLLASLPASPITPQTPSTPSKSTRKSRIPGDPVNISIYNLRKEGLAWDDIATRTNEDCKLSGDKELSDAACYSRFKRNGPLVAKAKEEDFKMEWYIHMKGKVDPKNGDSTDEVCGTEGEDKVAGASRAEEVAVLGAVEQVCGNFWTSVTTIVNASRGSKMLTEGEVKDVYERANGDDP